MLDTIKKLIPKPLFSLYHYSLGLLGNLVYHFPSHKLYTIGVTGTKGKTTTCYLIHQLLEKCAGKTALISTVFFAIGENFETNKTKMGMPGRFFLPGFLKRAIRAGAKYAVIETTSEGIAQHRQRFLDYNMAIFTSLSPEHIERHGSFVAYREAKEKLFKQCRETHVLNLNDKHVSQFIKYSARQKWGVILDKKIPEFFAETHCNASLLEGITTSSNRLKIKEWEIRNKKKMLVGRFEIAYPFPGKFNAINLLLSLAATRSTGIPLKKLLAVAPKLKLPPGRMQELTDMNIPFRVFLDYAHEPLSLKSVLETCREMLRRKRKLSHSHQNPKLICLVGAQGGGRDKWKRKVIGAIASKYCDLVVVATEDPYEEDPTIINKAILEGIVSDKNFQEEKNCWQFTDRRKAIRQVLSLAKSGDIVIITGKGGEKLMCVGNKKIPWNEEGEARKILKNIRSKVQDAKKS